MAPTTEIRESVDLQDNFSANDGLENPTYSKKLPDTIQIKQEGS